MLCEIPCEGEGDSWSKGEEKIDVIIIPEHICLKELRNQILSH